MVRQKNTHSQYCLIMTNITIDELCVELDVSVLLSGKKCDIYQSPYCEKVVTLQIISIVP